MKPVNLNKVRKARAKAEAKTRADANSVKHGRTKAEREAHKAAESARITRLDGHKRD